MTADARPGPVLAAGKQRQGFRPGQSGNPAGRPKGTRHPALLALDDIAAEGAAGVLRTVVQAAHEGDMQAAALLLKRVWPERRGRPVAFALPTVQAAGDVVLALGAVAAAVSAGDLSPEEGQAVAGIVEVQRRAIETEDLERRLAALEAARNTP